MENAGYLFAAFGIIWVGVFAFVLKLVNGQRKLRREIEALKEALQERKGE